MQLLLCGHGHQYDAVILCVPGLHAVVLDCPDPYLEGFVTSLS